MMSPTVQISRKKNIIYELKKISKLFGKIFEMNPGTPAAFASPFISAT